MNASTPPATITTKAVAIAGRMIAAFLSLSWLLSSLCFSFFENEMPQTNAVISVASWNSAVGIVIGNKPMHRPMNSPIAHVAAFDTLLAKVSVSICASPNNSRMADMLTIDIIIAKIAAPFLIVCWAAGVVGAAVVAGVASGWAGAAGC